MKRLILAALMGCMLIGQVKANVAQAACAGIAIPVVAGGIIAMGTQSTHMNFHQFTNGQSGPNIFFYGLDKTNIQPNPFTHFAQGEPIPNLGYRFASWTKWAGISGLCMLSLAALAKLLPKGPAVIPDPLDSSFQAAFGSLFVTAMTAHFVEQGLKPRTIPKTRNDEVLL
jgi:hypothetical protein